MDRITEFALESADGFIRIRAEPESGFITVSTMPLVPLRGPQIDDLIEALQEARKIAEGDADGIKPTRRQK